MTEFRPTRFQILPPVIKNLLIINGLVFLAQNTIGASSVFNMENLFALHNWQSPLFKPWQLFTHIFMHGSFMHILGNMFALWMFGSVLENLWGQKRFLIFYFVCGLGAAVLHMFFLSYEFNSVSQKFLALQNDPSVPQYLVEQYRYALVEQLNTATIGASGAVFGILAAFVYLFPNTYIYLYFFVPVKAKWLGLLYFGYELFFAIRNTAGDNVARWAHIGGAVVGLILVIIWKKKNTTRYY